MKGMLRVIGALLCAALMMGTAVAEGGELVLVSPMFQQATYISGETSDGGYAEQLTYADGLFVIEVLAADAGPDNGYPMVGETPFEEQMSLRYAGICREEMERMEQKTVSGYPSERLRFPVESGNGRTMVNAVAIWTEARAFVFTIEVDANAYEHDREGYAEGEVRAIVEDWIASLEIFDGSAAAASEANRPEETVTLVADFSDGLADGRVERYEAEVDAEVTVQLLAEKLSALSGLDFIVTGEQTEDGIRVEWQPESTLLSGLDDRVQREDFFFFDAYSLNWFMLDSLYATLCEYYETDAVFYSMSGGAPLTVPQLGPVNTFAPDVPYRGSVFYCAENADL